eukprot:CAMPEP_0181047372 /NCGR_PEP_ID=MMETSP1070-20121207/14845_1 /TAXON_ID=265543 /ORGANISM="Minutocellus polymorphus, Strain NH13" /LENGTH=314 /DNA_ID=CAMNT_0023126041 /DNA_START=190 /DNA_END=1134 /DNA_ORIENTATION=+
MDSPAYRYVRTLLLLSAGVLSSLPTASASTCECITINSWTTLRSVVQAALSIGALGTRPHILLCPFSITKTDEEAPLELSQQIFVQCMKDRDGDECTVRGREMTGVADDDLRPMVSIGADNVWVQGLTLTGARGGAVDIAEQTKGGKLIDMAIIGNSSPNDREGSVVDAKWGSLTHVIDTVFSENVGTALQNRGTMMVVSSRFLDNVATPFFDSSDNIEQGAGVGGAIMNSPGSTMVMNDCCFVGNRAETDGPAIWSSGNVAEVGGTCASSNVVTGDGTRNCNGVFDQESNACQPFSACGDGACTATKSTMRTR